MKNVSEVKKDFIWHMEVASEVGGVSLETKKLKYGVREQNYLVENETASKKIGKPMGKYTILSVPPLEKITPISWQYCVSRLSHIISNFMGEPLEKSRVLVVGLGNRQVLADSLGVACIKRVVATGEKAKAPLPRVFALPSGVFEQTGLESSDFVAFMAEKLKINKIIVIDTLCANNYNRLGTSFQVNSGGIVPGRGVGNAKKTINKQTSGVSVLSIGVPLVIYGSDLVKNALEEQGAGRGAKSSTCEKCNSDFLKTLFNKADNFSENFNNLLLTPSNIDAVLKNCGKMVGFALNKVLYGFSVSQQKKWLDL